VFFHGTSFSKVIKHKVSNVDKMNNDNDFVYLYSVIHVYILLFVNFFLVFETIFSLTDLFSTYTYVYLINK